MIRERGGAVKVGDWQGRPYTAEISYVSFLSGYVIWIDDDPYLEGTTFPSYASACKELKTHMAGLC